MFAVSFIIITASISWKTSDTESQCCSPLANKQNGLSVWSEQGCQFDCMALCGSTTVCCVCKPRADSRNVSARWWMKLRPQSPVDELHRGSHLHRGAHLPPSKNLNSSMIFCVLPPRLSGFNEEDGCCRRCKERMFPLAANTERWMGHCETFVLFSSSGHCSSYSTVMSEMMNLQHVTWQPTFSVF